MELFAIGAIKTRYPKDMRPKSLRINNKLSMW